ncbi:MAG: O-antigen ligase family protein, partial [Rhodomicrobium sp.]|nr:O-antigen ligase family protein [Rhodomicrobium sp.]
AAVFATQFGLGAILTRFETDPADDLRVPMNRTTFEMALRSLPLGTGLGSFVPVYATAEKEKDVFAGYANRAHDDFAELLLETGAAGALLLLAFIVWFARRAYQAWTVPRLEAADFPSQLAKASSLIIGLLLLHSLTDYPLRTTALAAVFAFFCAILAAPAVELPAQTQRGRAHAGKERVPGTRPSEPWEDEAGWPEAWQAIDHPSTAPVLKK